jgi:hypothetical protein
MVAEEKMMMKFLGRTLTAYEPLVGFPTYVPTYLPPTSPTTSKKKKKTLETIKMTDDTTMTDDTETLPKMTEDKTLMMTMDPHLKRRVRPQGSRREEEEEDESKDGSQKERQTDRKRQQMLKMLGS